MSLLYSKKAIDPPIIRFPYPSGIARDVTALAAELERWARYHRMVKDEKEYKAALYAHSTAMCWYYTTDERLDLITKSIFYAFWVDDVCEGATAEFTRDYLRRILDIVNNDKIVTPENGLPFESAISDLWQSFIPLTSPQWRYRFVRSQVVWLEGLVLEQEYRFKGAPPQGEYIAFRQHSTATELVLLMIEFANKELSNEVRGDPLMLTLQYCMQQSMWAVNDAYSWLKEAQVNDEVNLVAIFKKKYNCSPEEAVKRTIAFADEFHDMFIWIDRNLEELWPEAGEDERAFINGLKALIKGNEDYYRASSRYI